MRPVERGGSREEARARSTRCTRRSRAARGRRRGDHADAPDEKHTFEHVVDKGKKGESAGDIRTFGGFVYRGAAKVGHDQIRCVVGGTCNAQVWIRGGSLIARGFVVSGPDLTAKITDGTGRYAGARGTVKVSTGPVSHYTVAITS